MELVLVSFRCYNELKQAMVELAKVLVSFRCYLDLIEMIAVLIEF